MPNENIIQSKICKHCQNPFTITDKDLEFYDKISPVIANKKYSIPTPTFCPDCRQQRRLSFRNERNLHHRKCDLTGKDMISIYSPDLPANLAGKEYKVYDQEARWSDKRDPLQYGQSLDFNENFSKQFDILNKQVPHISLNTTANENSKYVNLS